MISQGGIDISQRYKGTCPQSLPNMLRTLLRSRYGLCTGTPDSNTCVHSRRQFFTVVISRELCVYGVKHFFSTSYPVNEFVRFSFPVSSLYFARITAFQTIIALTRPFFPSRRFDLNSEFKRLLRVVVAITMQTPLQSRPSSTPESTPTSSIPQE